MTKEEARRVIMKATQEAMRLYAAKNPNWLSVFVSIRDERIAYINSYVCDNTTTEARQLAI